MQTRRPLISRIAAGALACAGALFALNAQAQGSYFAIVPVSGSGAVGQLRPVKMALAGATPPTATVGVPYEFNLGALLSLDGPEGTTPDKVSWSIFSGRLPAGLELVGNRVTGVPEEASTPGVVGIRAEYRSGYQDTGAIQGYAFEVSPVGLADFGGYRAWADGTLAQSCNEYRSPNDKGHSYEGAKGDGVYRISPASLEPFDVHCDMSTDGGGWTLVEYASDLPFANRWTSGDAWRWVPSDFKLKLTPQQISALRAISTTAKQRYVGLCEGVTHYRYLAEDNYNYAIGFRFHTELISSQSQQVYVPSSIPVSQDGCQVNGGEGGQLAKATIFDIENINLPIVNVRTLDSGDASEKFGSPLTQYPARFR